MNPLKLLNRLLNKIRFHISDLQLAPQSDFHSIMALLRLLAINLLCRRRLLSFPDPRRTNSCVTLGWNGARYECIS